MRYLFFWLPNSREEQDEENQTEKGESGGTALGCEVGGARVLIV
jgi:hypothetical protein